MFTLFCRWLLSKILPTPALHKAAASGDLAGMRNLIRTGTPVDKRDAYGTQALHAAASAGQSEAIRLLVEARADINAFDGDKVTPLFRAVDKNHLEAVKLLLQLGAKVDAMGPDSVAPLHLCKTPEIATVLIDAGASVNLRSPQEGWGPLHWAASDDLPEVVRLLVEHGADHKAQDNDGYTALHHAVCSGGEMVQLLIDLGADIHAVDHKGNTPLHLASMRSPETIICLLRLGASTGTRNKAGKTPFDLAKIEDNEAANKAFADFANEAKTPGGTPGLPG